MTTSFCCLGCCCCEICDEVESRMAEMSSKQEDESMMTDEEVDRFFGQVSGAGADGLKYLRDRLYRWFGRDAVVKAIEGDSDEEEG